MRKLILSTQQHTSAGTIELNKVVSFSVQNTGTSTVIVGLNEDANNKIEITAGGGISFNAGCDRYDGQQLNIDFSGSGNNKCRIIIEKDGGEINDC